MKLKDKVAIITGSTAGIGKATALLFAKEGAKVVVVGRKRVTEGNQLVESIKKDGAQAIFVQTDVSQEEQVKAMIDKTIETFGKIDILFSNAGIMISKSATDITTGEWDRLMNVNVKSAYMCCKYAIPEIKRSGGGSVIIDSSVNATLAEPDIAAYCASKGALSAMTRAMAMDYGKDNIRVNCICPGWIETPMNADYFAVQGNRQKAGKLHALGRIGQPQEVAQAVLFLASDDASFITGSSLTIDGGLTAGFPEVF